MDEQLSFFGPDEHKTAWSKEEGDTRLEAIRSRVRALHFARMRADLNRATENYHDRRDD